MPEPDDIDCERLSRRGLYAVDVAEGTTMLLRAAAKAGSEPRGADVAASRPSPPPMLLVPARLPELSRRKRPMTDLGCLGLFIPPECFFSLYLNFGVFF